MAASYDDGAGDQYPYNGKVMLAAVISLSIVIFFVLLLHIYARWLLRQRRRRPVIRRVFREPLHPPTAPLIFPGHTAEIRLSVSGVDPRIVASLPVFVYRSEEHEHGLECVVCLSAMEEDESGRRLPECKHAFHVDCIDMWLMSHATCPICRSLVRVEEPPAPAEVLAAAAAASVMVVESEDVAAQVDHQELCTVVNVAGDVEVVVEVSSLAAAAANGQSIKEDESSSSSSFGSSLMRMLSRGRS
ncbi:hypothetical protein Cni_G25086 [Canna indica]|uniref:RING-type domain-containing protein n=1 Tax=Canna indica TaxID=4628 RepID=A0AAQ3KWZ0_9LILI|nr:hypothetical protein Cni_G25086 [Canna indica]